MTPVEGTSLGVSGGATHPMPVGGGVGWQKWPHLALGVALVGEVDSASLDGEWVPPCALAILFL